MREGAKMGRLKSRASDAPARARAAWRLATILLAIGVSLAAAGAAAAQPAPGDTLEWLDDYQEALARARAEGLPLLVEFRCAP